MTNIIANIGVNWRVENEAPHERATALVRSAHGAGVAAVCVPIVTPEVLFRHADIVERTKQYQLPREIVASLRSLANELGLSFIASPTDFRDVDFLEHLDVDGYHVQNGDLGYKPLISEIAKTDKAVFLSTGFAKSEEINDAVETILDERGEEPSESAVILLHSTGDMPTKPSEAQLMRILDLQEEFYPLYVGFESFLSGEHIVLDYVAMAYRPQSIMRRIDLDDGAGIESHYSLDPSRMQQLVTTALSMTYINSPQEYADGFVEGDFWARTKRLRCAESDYLVPPEK